MSRHCIACGAVSIHAGATKCWQCNRSFASKKPVDQKDTWRKADWSSALDHSTLPDLEVRGEDPLS